MRLTQCIGPALLSGVMASSFSTSAVEVSAQELATLKAQISALQARLEQLENQSSVANSDTAGQPASSDQQSTESVDLAEQKKSLASNTTEVAEPENSDGIEFGGAIRTNYSYTSYDDGNKNRGGDFDFDIFRINMSGEVGGVTLNSEIRFFDYMTAIKYAYAGYQFSENWQVQAGITKVPFGNQAYNSQNYFFSTNYYLGLEDDFDLGVVFKRSIADNWQLDLGFFKNDELGGVDGYVDNRSDRYSYDIVGIRNDGDGIYDEPTEGLGEYNTLAGRFAYHFTTGEVKTEVGVSALQGGIHNGERRAGDYQAWAFHTSSQYRNWHLQFQHSQYDYDIGQADRLAVGAYSFYDSIAADAKSTTLNIAYDMAVDFGPVTDLQFYNNFGLVYDKSDNSENTMMNVLGMSVAAGGLFTYFDFVHAKNQPFVGGSASGNSDETEQRFNINIGYYF
ncbi:MAG: porin [Paraglaciecola polaris]|uniref:porin n=1 Tax=Paraglaciecola polaris TaxID=222814 RepID=UPI0030022D82